MTHLNRFLRIKFKEGLFSLLAPLASLSSITLLSKNIEFILPTLLRIGEFSVYNLLLMLIESFMLATVRRCLSGLLLICLADPFWLLAWMNLTLLLLLIDSLSFLSLEYTEIPLFFCLDMRTLLSTSLADYWRKKSTC